jgi:hypothetical protein
MDTTAAEPRDAGASGPRRPPGRPGGPSSRNYQKISGKPPPIAQTCDMTARRLHGMFIVARISLTFPFYDLSLYSRGIPLSTP